MQQIVKTQDVLTRKNIINRISDVPGGISLVLSTLIVGNIVLEGSPLSVPADGKRTLCKQAKILTGSTTTVFRVETGTHHFKVGEFLGRIVGGLAYAITGIVVGAGAGYDTITIGTAIESATVGEFVYEMAAESATTTSALENAADVLLKEAYLVPSTAQVIIQKDAYVRSDIEEGFLGSLYLATVDANEVKY